MERVSIGKYVEVAKAVGADKKRQARNMGEAIGSLVTDLRMERGWSQAEFAHRVGLNESTIRFLEMATKSPTLRTLEAVARTFSMEDVVELMQSAKKRLKR